ncbi:MAG: DedA family protein [Pseudomonadota bacterium]
MNGAGNRLLKALDKFGHRPSTIIVLSAAEATVVPVPLEIILLPIMQRNRTDIWRIAVWAILGCLIGAFVFYFLALFAMQTIGEALISSFGWQGAVDTFDRLFADYGFWAIVAAGIFPVPLQLGMLTAGATAYPILLFALAIFLSRAFRYFGIGLIVFWYGDRAEELYGENKPKLIAIGCAALLIVWLITYGLGRLIS